MSEIKIDIGVQDPAYTVQHFDPGVVITIRGSHALSMEVLQYLEEFSSAAGPIEVK